MSNFRPMLADVEAVILRCLEKDREHRWASIGELAIALAPHHRSLRLHVSRANRGKTSEGIASRQPGTGGQASQGCARPPCRHRQLDPAEAASARLADMVGYPAGPPQPLATTELVGHHGIGRRPATGSSGIALGAGFLALAGLDS